MLEVTKEKKYRTTFSKRLKWRVFSDLSSMAINGFTGVPICLLKTEALITGTYLELDQIYQWNNLSTWFSTLTPRSTVLIIACRWSSNWRIVPVLKILFIIGLRSLRYYFIHTVVHLAIVFMLSIKVYLTHHLTKLQNLCNETIVNIVVMMLIINIKNLELKSHFLNIEY